MSNFVSFSLWGGAPRYTRGCFKNIDLVRKHLPGWTMIVWYDGRDTDVLHDLIANRVTVHNCLDLKWCSPYAWRFLVNDFKDAERYIIRDCDSRISEREAFAVQDWVDSGRPFHIIRDHPDHGRYPINAGMWGSMQGFIHDMNYLLKMFKWPDKGYLFDQEFLKAVVWPRAQHVALQHDGGTKIKYRGTVPLPDRKDRRFVGERFDEYDIPNPHDQEALGA